MKHILICLIVTTLFLIACEEDNSPSLEKEKSAKTNLHNPQEYSWANYDVNKICGEILFVPVYSSIYHQSNRTFDLTATLSIHNTDINSQITLVKVDYFGTDGNLVKNFIDADLVLNPLQSKQFIIKETDKSGGTAAKFVIQWISSNKVIKPIVEAVMISTTSQQGISFKTESRIISSVGYE